jgi:small-conductance mechanosensitive channel
MKCVLNFFGRLIISILIFGGSLSIAQQPDSVLVQQQDSVPAPTGVPVMYQGDTLFIIYSAIGPFTPENRALAIENRLKVLTRSVETLGDSFSIRPTKLTVDILYGNEVLMSLTEEDALPTGKTNTELAKDYRNVLQSVILGEFEVRSSHDLIKNIGLFALALLGLILIFWALGKGFTWLNKTILGFKHNMIFRDNRVLKLFNYITPRRERDILTFISKFLRLFISLLVLFLYLPLMFSLLPWTRGLVNRFFTYLKRPVTFMVDGLLDFLPDLFFIIVIFLITYYLLRFLKYLSKEVEAERIRVQGFYGEWARPTFKIVRVLLYIFALVIVFPYLPGSDSPAFQGISIFLGVLLSLGSTSAVSNVVAGIVITYMRPFSIGDRVRIGDTFGDVVDRTLLVTRVRTIKNEDITIPNANILNTHMWNYSVNAKELGVILHTTVTIGYDVPWKQVRDLLLQAARLTEGVEENPEPFVLQTSLEDFYIQYEINATTRNPNKMARTYSDLHRNILEQFNEAGVEILSPHYRAVRDGNILTIPPENIPEGYQKPGFYIEPQDKNEN